MGQETREEGLCDRARRLERFAVCSPVNLARMLMRLLEIIFRTSGLTGQSYSRWIDGELLFSSIVQRPIRERKSRSVLITSGKVLHRIDAALFNYLYFLIKYRTEADW